MKFIEQDKGSMVGCAAGVDGGILAAFGDISLDEESSKQLNQFILVQYSGTVEMKTFEEFGVRGALSIHGLFVGKEVFAVEVR